MTVNELVARLTSSELYQEGNGSRVHVMVKMPPGFYMGQRMMPLANVDLTSRAGRVVLMLEATWPEAR